MLKLFIESTPALTAYSSYPVSLDPFLQARTKRTIIVLNSSNGTKSDSCTFSKSNRLEHFGEYCLAALVPLSVSVYLLLGENVSEETFQVRAGLVKEGQKQGRDKRTQEHYPTTE